jgi:Tol biopolymer transport system component
MSLNPGTKLGPYEILSPLGAGGMGEVYRARDTRLGRDVAVKVLPQHLSENAEVRARFEREAKTVSSLNHPHICVLHDVGRQGNTDYLVMELIEGETLAMRLSKGPLPLTDVLRIGSQIAGALDRAHRAGIVHRDLKPGNVMLTKSGAKLMDFGLARSAGLPGAPGSGASVGALTQSPTQAQPLTAEGTIVGTFQYMSPEQLEGKEADERSDIWALGCVLYEMITGQRAFEGKSQASLIAAIMTGEPRALTDLQPVAPSALDRVIRQCIQKDPVDRLQSAHDLAFALDLIGGGELRGAAASRDERVRGRVRWWWPGAAAVIVLAGFIAGRVTAPQEVEGSIRVSTLSQGTQDSEPAVSRDGRLIVFTAVRQNGQGLWLMDMATRSEVKLTSDADRMARFTADGGNVLFTRLKGGRPSLWRVPVIGGSPRLVLESASDADPSPDGSEIAYVGSVSDSTGVQARLMLARSDGTGGRVLWAPGTLVLGSPRWSTDGARIAVITSGGQNAPNSFAVVDVKSGKVRDIAAPSGAVLSTVAWDGTDDGVIVAEGVGVTAVQRGAPGRLYRCDIRSGKYTPLGWLENFPGVIDLLPDGQLVMSSTLVRQNLREVSTTARDLSGGRRLTSGMALDRQPVYSPDGKWVMFSSNRGGTLDLWEVSVETGEMHRVTDDPEDDWDPEYGPDGGSVVWCSGRSGAFEIWAARRDGTASRQLSHDGLDAENPSISPDGRWVYYSSSNAEKTGLWRIPAEGGEGEHLLYSGTLIPDLSPDGRYLSVIVGMGTVAARLSVFDLQENRELPSPVPLQVYYGAVQTGRSRFAPDGRSVVYVDFNEDGRPVLMRRPVSAWRTGGGAAEILLPDATETVESFGFTTDGERMVVSLVDWLSGLTIAEVPGIVPPKRNR